MGKCSDSRITFHTETLQKLVDDPEWVLGNQERFWSDYRAMKLVRKWAEHVNYHIQYDKWRESVEEWAGLSRTERKDHQLVRMAERILGAGGEFQQNVIRHNCRFVPNGFDLSVNVQFTAFVPPFAFAMEDLVIDVASKHWKGDPEHILNLLMHEVFHVAYSRYRKTHDERNGVSQQLYSVLDNIANEGICTYVGYRALPIYQVKAERDYVMMDDPAMVQEKFQQTNSVLQEHGRIPEEDFRKLSWEKGVVERAYYVTGAVIAQTIDRELGREKLIEVYGKGPVSILELYSTVADAGLTLTLPPLSDRRSP